MPKASDTSHIARVLIMKMTFSYVVYRMSQFKRFSNLENNALNFIVYFP